ncbi:MAG: hypothetical protein AAGJ87_06340 [Pseudomonadota bacterium]
MATALAKKEIKKQSLSAVCSALASARLPLVRAAEIIADDRRESAVQTPGESASPSVVSPLNAAGLHDIAGDAYADFAAAFGFTLAAAHQAAEARGKPLFICEQIISQADQGALYGPGLAHFGIAPDRIIIASVRSEQDLLWCAEEALACGGLGAVVLRLSPREKKYAFTPSRRLHLRAIEAGVPAFVVRGSPARAATAAESLWRVGARPSKPVSPFVARAAAKRILGEARALARLERARATPPASYELGWSCEEKNRKRKSGALRLDLAVPLADGLAVANDAG